MKLKIGYRTLKTAIGAPIAIAIAAALQLEYYTAAGIITILCISTTRRKSLLVSWHRIAAALLAIAISALLFGVLGYHLLTLAVILFLFIPATVKLNITDGIVTSCVIVLHMYAHGMMTFAMVLNEFFIIIIGISVALLMNWYMPSNEKKLKEFKTQIEEQFKIIFTEMSAYLRHGESTWDGKEIPATVELLKRGKNLALTNLDNYILRNENQYYHYFNMREKQFEIIERLMPFVSRINRSIPQGIMVANFLEELSESISPTNQGAYFLEKLDEMEKSFRTMSLPETREEFEMRSSLFYMMHELEQYLYIKEKLWNRVDKQAF